MRRRRGASLVALVLVLGLAGVLASSPARASRLLEPRDRSDVAGELAEILRAATIADGTLQPPAQLPSLTASSPEARRFGLYAAPCPSARLCLDELLGPLELQELPIIELPDRIALVDSRPGELLDHGLRVDVLGLLANPPPDKGFRLFAAAAHLNESLRARWLDTRNGAFLDPDPAGTVDSPNLYAAMGSQPSMATDPLGLYSWYEFGRDLEFGWDVYLGTMGNLYDPANADENAMRALGGLVGTGKFIGETAVGLGSLALDTGPLLFTEGAQDRIAERALGLGSMIAHPIDTVAGSWNGMIANVEAHEAAGEHFSSGMVAGEWGATAAATVAGAAELGVAAARATGRVLARPAAATPLGTRGAQLRAQYADVFPEYMRFRKQGRVAREAKKLSEPYNNGRRMGHHSPVPRAAANRVGLPAAVRDSPFNVLNPRGMNTGRFYELHYRLDPNFHGAALGRGMTPWRGADLGLTRLQGWRRVWHASPGPLKFAVGAAGAGAAGAGIAWWLSE